MAEAGGQVGHLPTQILAEQKVQCRCAELLFWPTLDMQSSSVYIAWKIISLGDHQLICHMQKLIKKIKKITHFQKISRKWQGQHISSYSWPILDFGQRECGALLILAYIKQMYSMVELLVWKAAIVRKRWQSRADRSIFFRFVFSCIL